MRLGPCGGTGRRARLKILYPQGCAGSSPARGTMSPKIQSIFGLMAWES